MKEKLKNAIWATGVIVVAVIIMPFILRTPKQETAAFEVSKQAVNLKSLDGLELSADLFEPATGEGKQGGPYPGLVLLSPFGESREIYADFATLLCRQGVVVLSVDVRNSGESTATPESIVESIGKLDLDADAAVSYLQNQPSTAPNKIAILGTAITARSALMVSDLDEKIRAAVLVSAVLDSTGYEIIRSSPDCPILVLVSIQDGASASQARDIYEASANPASRIESYVNAGAGSDLWRVHMKFEMMSLIHDWLTTVL
ncbi:dienelactone hydrolase family protein [bacterium]|nr:dienelactone hydrolase family protein [bacterium]